MSRRNRKPYRNGTVHVCRVLCNTCIFRPGNLMSLAPGRVEELVSKATRAESCIPCHHTISGDQAVCAGFFRKHKTAPLQIAERMNLITFVEPPEEL